MNRRDSAGYDAGLQRHHLLPRQLLRIGVFATLFDRLGLRSVGFEDFRRNGLLLPANDEAAVRMGLPLHRGPHRDYNAMVIERVGEIESAWQQRRKTDHAKAGERALCDLARLQDRLRERLLNPRTDYLRLHSKDPLGSRYDYTELDAMAERLWKASRPYQEE